MDPSTLCCTGKHVEESERRVKRRGEEGGTDNYILEWGVWSMQTIGSKRSGCKCNGEHKSNTSTSCLPQWVHGVCETVT